MKRAGNGASAAGVVDAEAGGTAEAVEPAVVAGLVVVPAVLAYGSGYYLRDVSRSEPQSNPPRHRTRLHTCLS